MVDSALLASKLSAIRDAVERIRVVLPESSDTFLNDRTQREVVTLNLFVAIQECIALASHIVADAGWAVPKTYAESFTVLAERQVLNVELAERMRAAAGLRNLLAHQYGTIDFDRLYGFVASRLGDLSNYCSAVAHWSRNP